MSDDSTVFNPLDKKNLGASVAEALLGRKPRPLGELTPFAGAGIYALYYTGSFEPYEHLAQRNRDGLFEAPIYVGKAIPKGGREGGPAVDGGKPSRALFDRLREHAESIRATDNLDIADFQCRHLVVDDIWIPQGETLLITKFSPIWNHIVEGFGNHDPGAGRHQGKRPLWDVLHPGRAWALKCAPRTQTATHIAEQARNHLTNTSPTQPHFYLEERRAQYSARSTDSQE